MNRGKRIRVDRTILVIDATQSSEGTAYIRLRPACSRRGALRGLLCRRRIGCSGIREVRCGRSVAECAGKRALIALLGIDRVVDLTSLFEKGFDGALGTGQVGDQIGARIAYGLGVVGTQSSRGIAQNRGDIAETRCDSVGKRNEAGLAGATGKRGGDALCARGDARRDAGHRAEAARQALNLLTDAGLPIGCLNKRVQLGQTVVERLGAIDEAGLLCGAVAVDAVGKVVGTLGEILSSGIKPCGASGKVVGARKKRGGAALQLAETVVEVRDTALE